MLEYIKKDRLYNLAEIYSLLGGSKTDLFRWHKKPYSFNSTNNNAKIKVIKNSQEVFCLTNKETEYLANTTRLSLSLRYNAVAMIQYRMPVCFLYKHRLMVYL